MITLYQNLFLRTPSVVDRHQRHLLSRARLVKERLRDGQCRILDFELEIGQPKPSFSHRHIRLDVSPTLNLSFIISWFTLLIST